MRLAATLCAVVLGTAGCPDDPTPGTTGNLSDVGSATDAGGDAGAVGPDVVTPAPDVGPPPDLGERLVFLAEAGVYTPWLHPVEADGPGTPRQLGPSRASGYGQREGDVAYAQVTPDGRSVVVMFEDLRRRQSWYALALDGSGVAAPVRVATGEGFYALDRAYSADGWLGYVADGDLYAAPLDGSRADSPVLVATAPEGERVERPRWVPGQPRLVFELETWGTEQIQSTVHSAAADGSEVTTFATLTTATGGQHRAGFALPDGRVVLRQDKVFYAVDAGGGALTRLTPEGQTVSAIGVSADGARLVLELGLWSGPQELASVATDGSEADAPVAISDGAVAGLDALVDAAAGRVAWIADEAEGWTVYEAPLDGSEAPRRVIAWQSGELDLSDYDAGRGVLVGTNDAAVALAFPLPGGPDAQPLALHAPEGLVNHCRPWPLLNASATWVSYTCSTTDGWQSWAVPVAGGDPVVLGHTLYSGTEHGGPGMVYSVPHREGAGYVAGEAGPEALSPWRDAALTHARLVEQGAWLLFRSEAPEPAWYAAPTAGGPARAVMPSPPPGQYQALYEPPVVDGRLIARADDRLVSYALDGSELEAPVTVLDGVTAAELMVPALQRVVALRGADLVSARVSGADAAAPTLIAPAVGMIHAITATPDGGRVVAVVGGPGPNVLLVAGTSPGADAAGPQVLGDVYGWPLGLSVTPDQRHVLLTLSVEATAVPHPDQAMTVPLDPAAGAGLVALAPHGYVLWAMSPWAWEDPDAEPARGPTTPDGELALLFGPEGLYTARVDGSDAAAPTLIAARTGLTAQGGREPFHPDGRTVLLSDGERVLTAQAGVADSAVAVTPDFGRPVVAAVWARGGETIVIHAGYDTFYYSPGGDPDYAGGLWQVPADGSADPTPLHVEGVSVDALASLTPDGAGVVFASRDLGDHALYFAPIVPGATPAPPIPLTPIDDAAEAFVGFAP